MLSTLRLARYRVHNFQYPALRVFSSNCERHIDSLRLAASTLKGDGADDETSPVRTLLQSDNPLPVGIFIDLDNVSPVCDSRKAAKDFARPLRKFAEKVGTLVTFRAFGNKHTQSYISSTVDEEEMNPPEFDMELAHTGFDSDGLLRCGVCGAKMKLTKKDKKQGRDVHDKLAKHMKSLHTREQTKRINRRKQTKKRLSEKEQKRFDKYKSSQVGFFRKPNKNNLFTVLKEQGVHCFSTDDVDETLMKSARQWMHDIKVENKEGDKEAGGESSIQGCLVVYTGDTDFVGLLQSARKRRFLAVTATDKPEQTRKLKEFSDLVLKPADQDLKKGFVTESISVDGKALVKELMRGDARPVQGSDQPIEQGKIQLEDQ